MKLLIADDHTLFRDTLVQYIQRANARAKIALAKDFQEAMDILSKDQDFNLIILDLGMPGMDGMAGFKTLKTNYPGKPFALMSGIADQQDVRAALELGAVGYFPKTLPGKTLIMAIEQVLKGEVFIPEDHSQKGIMPSHYNEHKKSTKQNVTDLNFTPRESEVLSYLVDGATNKEIARALDLQIVTIKLHVRGICRKLGAHNRTQAALIAKELGVKSAKATTE